MNEQYLRLMQKHFPKAYQAIQDMTEQEKIYCNYEDDKKDIVVSFQWADTKQGYEYWRLVEQGMRLYTRVGVNYSLVNLLNKLDIDKPIRSSDNFYDFTWLAISETNPTRLSGMRKPWELEPTAEERAEKGVYLKPGKVLAALYPGLENIPMYAEKLARLLRQENIYSFDGIQLSDTPSDIYCTKTRISSCMQGVDKAWLAIYDQIPNCRILYKRDTEGYLIGRALVWSNVNDDKITLMDRIYFYNDDALEEFKNYARKEGWHYKNRQSTNSYDIVCPGGEIREMQLQVPVDCDLKIEACPYFDTFPYYNSDNTLTSHHGDNYVTFMQYVEGVDSMNYFAAKPTTTCSDCGCDIADGVEYNINGRVVCSECCNNYFYCDHCGNHYDNDEMNYVDDQLLCNSCYNDPYTTCQCCNEAVHIEASIVDYRERVYCQSCADDTLRYCYDCDEYHNADDFTETIGDEWVCSDCACQYTLCPECGLLYHTGETCCIEEVEEC